MKETEAVIEEITKEMVEETLRDFKECILHDKMVFSQRPINQEIFDNYVLNIKSAKDILLNLTYLDFSSKELDNSKNAKKDCNNNPYEYVHVFGKEVALVNRFDDEYPSETEQIEIYIKFNRRTVTAESLIVISFHKAKHKIDYYFK